MKHKRLIAGTLIVVLIGLCAVSLFATWQGVQMVQDSGIQSWWFDSSYSLTQYEATATEEKNLTVSGPANLTVQNDSGDITVKTGADGQVAIKAEKSVLMGSDNAADEDAALKNIKVIVEQNGNNIHISVQQPPDVGLLHIGPGNGSVKFTITVPAETAVTLDSSNGDLSLSGTSGNANLKTDFGKLNITDVVGEITGKTSNGETTAKNIGAGGLITLSSEFGAVSVDNAKGSDVTISSSNGSLEQLKNIHATGLLKVTNEFGKIRVTGSQAKTAEIRSNNGEIRLENIDVDGSITVKSDFGSLTLNGVNAKTYDLNTQNGQISLDGAQNAIKVHSDFGSVEVLNASDATVDLSSNNGTVTFAGTLGSGPHIVKSDFGSIEMTLPAASALNVEMQTDFGKIISDFSISISGEIDSKHWNGSINGGGATLTVTTNNGNITLQSSK